MIRIPSIFSNNALYQQQSNLDIHGNSSPNIKIYAKIYGTKGIYSEVETSSDISGCFALSLKTPTASFEKYSISILPSDSEGIVLENIVFGELWLASGQSNMEMTNSSMIERDDFLASLKNYNIRCYRQQPLGNGGTVGPFPVEPSDELPGIWCEAQDKANMLYISATATSFAKKVYDTLNMSSEIPVGILNSSMGATSIECWLPKEDVMDNNEIYTVLKKQDRLPTEKWDTYGDNNFLQPCALFNQKIYPLIGVKARGVIWYQGESNVSAEYKEFHYTNCLKRYQETYSKLFMSESCTTFPMISSLLYPWCYGGSGECNMSYINKAFTDTAESDPDKFAAATIHDLSSVWSFFESNHPIHPANKYPLGERMGLIALNNCYGGNGQKTAPVFLNMEKCGEKLVITFKNVGDGLKCNGRIRGFYICSDKNLYQQADVEIIAKNKVTVCNNHITNPQNVAYQYSSMETDGNLFAGELPIAPFATDRDNVITIELKPWLNLEQTVWVFNCHDDINDMFCRPTWHPAADSEICADDVFNESGKSLRILGDGSIIGAYVKSYYYNALDLQNYKALRFDLFNNRSVKCTAEFIISISQNEKRIIKLEGTKLADKKNGWSTFEILLDNLNYSMIERMTLWFDMNDNRYRFVNIDNLDLIPKE